MDVTRIAEQVLAFLRAEAAELADNLTELEPRVLERMRRIGARVIERRLAADRLGYSGPSRPCGCGRTQRFVEHRPKTLATLLGVEQPFAGGARVLYELTGQRLSESTVMRLTERVGAPVEAACKHVVGVRMKRNGMRWSPAGAPATLSPRAVWLDGDWNTFRARRPLTPAACEVPTIVTFTQTRSVLFPALLGDPPFAYHWRFRANLPRGWEYHSPTDCYLVTDARARARTRNVAITKELQNEAA